jgi:predicted nucleic acid-binding protein
MSNYLDFINLFIKLAKVEFCKYVEKKKQYKTKRILKSTIKFWNDLEILTYELSKLALVDGFLKRYMKSYISASLICLALDNFADIILKDLHNYSKYDMD